MMVNNNRPVLAITCGEPAGIGPEIALRAAWALRADVDSILIGDAALLRRTAQALNAASDAPLDAPITPITLDVIALNDWQKNNALPLPLPSPGTQLTVIDC